MGEFSKFDVSLVLFPFLVIFPVICVAGVWISMMIFDFHPNKNRTEKGELPTEQKPNSSLFPVGFAVDADVDIFKIMDIDRI